MNIDCEKFSLIKEKMIINRFNYHYPNGYFEYSCFKNNHTFVVDEIYFIKNDVLIKTDFLTSIVKIRKNYISVDLFCSNENIDNFKTIFNLKDLDRRIGLVQKVPIDENNINSTYCLKIYSVILSKYAPPVQKNSAHTNVYIYSNQNINQYGNTSLNYNISSDIGF